MISDFLKYWKTTWNWRYGNCFTFNSGATSQGKRKPVLTITKPGPQYGKKLLKQKQLCTKNDCAFNQAIFFFFIWHVFYSHLVERVLLIESECNSTITERL